MRVERLTRSNLLDGQPNTGFACGPLIPPKNVFNLVSSYDGIYLCHYISSTTFFDILPPPNTHSDSNDSSDSSKHRFSSDKKLSKVIPAIPVFPGYP